MAEKSSQDEIMPLPHMKQILGLAEREKLGCAFGLTKDKKEILLLIDKNAKPKKAAELLKKDGKAVLDPATLRFGEVNIDVPNDPGTVRFSVNRSEAGGTMTLMSKLIKKAGYQAIVINADPGLETAEDDTGDTAAAASAAAAPLPPVATAPRPPSPPPINPGALKARLTGLVQRVGPAIAAAPQRKDVLMTLAKEAQGLLVAGDLPNAARKAGELEAALGGGSNGAAPRQDGMWEAPKATDGAAVAFAKSSQLWRSCRGQMQTKLGTLKTAILDAYADEPEVAAELRKNMGTLDRAFAGLDTRLDDTLDAAISAGNPAQRQKLAADSRTIIASYIKYVASDQMLQALDDNPFGVQLGLKDTLSKVLTALVGLSESVA